MGNKIYFHYLKDDDPDRLLAWWRSLDDNRGDRARFRRAESPDDVLLTSAFFNFLQAMPERWAKLQNLPVSAMVAATLSHAKPPHKGSESFAATLAAKKTGSDRPVMSELRFQQLQKSRTPDDFFRRLIRAVKLVDSNINILSLADDIGHWVNEYRYGVDAKPLNRLAVSWANDYYSQQK